MPKAAIVYLVPGMTESLEESLISLEKCFLSSYPHYPVVMFHEKLSQKEIKQLASLISTPLIPVKLNRFLKTPKHLDSKQISRWNAGLDGGRKCNLGYIQMCRFFADGLYRHKAMDQFEYYWRFDDDSFLVEPLKSDPFVEMVENDWIYGYRCIERENIREILGLGELWKETKQFARKHRVSLKEVKKLTCNWWGKYKGVNFYNNFEINKIAFWRDCSLQAKYIECLEEAAGFYKYRWGDANIRTLAIGMFINPKQIHHFKEIPYRHNYHYAIPGGDGIEYSLTRPNTFNT